MLIEEVDMMDLARDDLITVEEHDGTVLTGRFIRFVKDPITGTENNIRYFDGVRGCEGVIPHQLIKSVVVA